MGSLISRLCVALLAVCLFLGGVQAAAGAAMPADNAGMTFVDDDGSAGCWAVSPSAQSGPQFHPDEERLPEGKVPGDTGRRPPQPRSLSPPAA